MSTKTNGIPTASEIRERVQSGNDRHFFDRETMKFFGDTMRNFGTYYCKADDTIRLYRKKAVKHGLMGEWIYNEETGSLKKVSKD